MLRADLEGLKPLSSILALLLLCKWTAPLTNGPNERGLSRGLSRAWTIADPGADVALSFALFLHSARRPFVAQRAFSILRRFHAIFSKLSPRRAWRGAVAQ